MKINKKYKRGLFVILSSLLLIVAACDAGNLGTGGVITQDCNFSNNLSETADSFISRCRKGSIRREFPREYYNKTLKEINNDKSKIGKKARKLLNDNRFKK